MLGQGARGFIERDRIEAVEMDGSDAIALYEATRPVDQAPSPLSPGVRDGPAILLHDHQHGQLMDRCRTIEHVEVVGRHAAIPAVERHELAGLLTLEGESHTGAEGGQRRNLAEVRQDVEAATAELLR